MTDRIAIENIFKGLAMPFPEEDVEWRIQQSGAREGRPWALILPFINTRAVTSRLDDVLGPENWKCKFEEIDAGFLCELSIHLPDGSWLSREDGASKTDIEPVKGGISDSLKRAAALFGVGKYLYAMRGPFYAVIKDDGQYFGKTKDGAKFRWDAPSLGAHPAAEKVSQMFSLPAGDVTKAVTAFNTAPHVEAIETYLNMMFAKSWGEEDRAMLIKKAILRLDALWKGDKA